MTREQLLTQLSSELQYAHETYFQNLNITNSCYGAAPKPCFMEVTKIHTCPKAIHLQDSVYNFPQGMQVIIIQLSEKFI